MKVRKILACILAFAMILSTMSFTAYAESTKLPDAVDGVITLTEDVVLTDLYAITEGTEVTIDLNGHTITCTGEAYFYIASHGPSNVGVLTVKDTSDEGNGVIDGVICVQGVLNVESGTITSAGYGTGANYIPATIMLQPDSWAHYPELNVSGGKIEFTADPADYEDYVAAGVFSAIIGSNTNGRGGVVDISGDTVVESTGGCILMTYTYDHGDVIVKDGTFISGEGFELFTEIGGSQYTEAPFVIYDGTFSVSVPDEYLADGFVIEENEDGTYGVINTNVAKIGDVYYATLEEAIDAAQENDVIDLMGGVVDLPEVNSLKIKMDLTIQNGTIDITDGVWNGNSIIEIYGGTASDFVTVSFNNVDFVGDNYSSAYGVIYAYNYGKAVINDSDFVLSNERFSAGGVLKGNGVAQSAFDVNNSTFTLENPNRIIANATVNLDNVTIDAAVTDDTLVVGTMNNHAFRNLVGTVNDSYISVDGFETGIKNTDGSLTVTGDSKVVLTNSKDTDLIVSGNNSLSVADTSELIADTTDIADTSKVTGNVVKKADSVEVDFELATSDETSLTYNIVLKGISAETINRLNSADLTFALNQFSGKNTYEIIDVANDNIAVNPVYNVADGSIIDGRYEFHFEHKDGVANDTAAKIVIAQVKFTGYGKFNFGVAKAATNEVHATKIRDNIVETYIPVDNDSDIVEGELVVDNDIENAEIIVPKRDLTINVSFPNNIVARPYAYQAMKVTVAGPENYERVIYLGNGDAVNKEGDCENLKVAGDVVYYEETISGELTLNSPYTVTVEGAGYRTVKYTVNMTEDKTLNFWNNVKDNAKAVEVSESGVEKYAQKVTFLAGDIVKDNEINVYDLSAVVSYFGEIDLSETNKKDYAKYDLNRDGKIDSRDVAYVLVSWGN